jgi:hypothetical protein
MRIEDLLLKSGVNSTSFAQKWPQIHDSSQNFLQQSINFEKCGRSPPVVLARELSANCMGDAVDTEQGSAQLQQSREFG